MEYMTGQQSLIARTALSILVGGISSITCFATFPENLSRSSFDRLVNVSFVASRLAIYACIFLVLRIAPRGDIPAYYWFEAKSVLNHLLPYRDFTSSYAPLHPYLDALVIRVWYSPLAIILFAICIEALILPLWFKIGRTFLAEKEVRLSALLYLTSAMSVQFVTIDGQDNVLIGALLVLALSLIYRSRIFASGAAIGLSVAAVKFLPLLYVPAFLVATQRRLQWIVGAGTIIMIVYIAFLAIHLPLFAPLLFEGAMRSSGNLPFLVEGITGITIPSVVWNSLVLFVCGLIILLIASKSRGVGLLLRLRILTFGFAALTLALVLFSKKSWPPYLMMCLFPLGLLFRRENKLNIVGFALFQVVSVVSLSFWSTVLSQNNSSEFHAGLLAHQPNSLILLGLQIALIVGYGSLLKLSLNKIRDAQLPPELASR
jgi:hypothetical protein